MPSERVSVVTQTITYIGRDNKVEEEIRFTNHSERDLLVWFKPLKGMK